MRDPASLLRVVLFSACIGACLNVTGCGKDKPGSGATPGLIVLVTVDSFRADRLSLYGGPVGMPALEGLAGKGTVYEDMTTVVPQSRPATATILTGALPVDHGVRNDVSDRLGDTDATLPRTLGEAGFGTAAFVGSAVDSWSSGFQHSFDLFDGPDGITIGPGAYAPPVLPSDESLDHFESWMNDREITGPRFAWIHLADLQDVATDSQPGSAMETYDQALSGLDGQFRRLFAFLEPWAAANGNVDIVLVGTYGVYLEDDEFKVARGSSYWLDRETLQVPAIIARIGEDSRTADRDISPCWLPDLGPTLHALATGVALPTGHGVDLKDPDTAATRADRVRFAWTWAPDDELVWPVLTAVNTGSRWETFDSNDLAQEPAGAAGENRALALARTHAAKSRGYRLSEEVRREVRGTGIRLGDRNQPSPEMTAEERARFLTELFHLRNHFAQGRDRRTARTSNRMLSAYPDNLAVLYSRGAFVLMNGGVEPAEPLFATMLERYPDTPEVLHWAAHLELARDQPDRAFALLEAARSLGWSDGDLLYDMACVHARRGAKQEALASLEEAIGAGYRNWAWIDQDPDLASVRADPGYARIMSARGR